MRSRKGTSIVEAAVAIALMGIILLWSITAYTNISTQSKTSEDIEIASTLASRQIESSKALQYTGVSTTGIQSITNSPSVVPFASPYVKYGYKYASVSVQETSTVYLKTVAVEIYRMIDQANPIMEMDCSFLRNKGEGKNAGL
jgi:Tfp pilus assembly protein PilE